MRILTFLFLIYVAVAVSACGRHKNTKVTPARDHKYIVQLSPEVDIENCEFDKLFGHHWEKLIMRARSYSQTDPGRCRSRPRSHWGDRRRRAGPIGSDLRPWQHQEGPRYQQCGYRRRIQSVDDGYLGRSPLGTHHHHVLWSLVNFPWRRNPVPAAETYQVKQG